LAVCRAGVTSWNRPGRLNASSARLLERMRSPRMYTKPNFVSSRWVFLLTEDDRRCDFAASCHRGLLPVEFAKDRGLLAEMSQGDHDLFDPARFLQVIQATERCDDPIYNAFFSVKA